MREIQIAIETGPDGPLELFLREDGTIRGEIEPGDVSYVLNVLDGLVEAIKTKTGEA